MKVSGRVDLCVVGVDLVSVYDCFDRVVCVVFHLISSLLFYILQVRAFLPPLFVIRQMYRMSLLQLKVT